MPIRVITPPDGLGATMPMSRQQLEQRLRGGRKLTDLGLYIHIPFCQKRCHFCAFYLTIHREDLVRNFLLALEQEIGLLAQILGDLPVSSVYVGGGTPTSLTSRQLVRILEVLAEQFHLTPQVEVTVEASPDTVTLPVLKALRQAGVNRLSLGAQTFDQTVWVRLGRSGNIPATRMAIEYARLVGFQNINVDLMYGLPDQTLESWQQSLTEVTLLNPTHVSCYALTLEEGTQFHMAALRGEIQVGQLELENTMYETAISYLTTAGYEQYEISNYCQPGNSCRHNLRYWTGQDYLGMGPSAQSYIGNVRFGNIDNLREYCRDLGQKELPLASIETLTPPQADRERVVFALRLVRGLNLQNLEEVPRDPHWWSAVQQLVDDGLLCDEGSTLRLTANGRRFADSVAVDLL